MVLVLTSITECKNLISRMLVTDPKQRASLSEILNHPWITKGFNAAPENYLPHREPLQLPLDSMVVNKMTGFDFGPAEYITRELTKVLQSEEYQNAVRLNAREQAAQALGNERKRGVFDFYKRRNSTTSRDTLPNTSFEAIQSGSDPVNAFSPLISIYYLVREKMEREKIEKNPGALSMPVSSGEKPLQMPDLPAPEAAYTNSYTHEMPGEKATGGRARARSRTQGEDDVADGLKKVNLDAPQRPTPPVIVPAANQQPAKRESTGLGILRRFSTRRGTRPERPTETASQKPSQQLAPPSTETSTLPRKSFSVRKSRNKESAPAALLHPGGSTPNQPDLLKTTDAIDVRSRTSNTLDRSTSVNSADYRKRQSRRGVSEGQPAAPSLEPPLTSDSDRSSIGGHKSKEGTASLDPKSNLNARAAATNRTKSLGHARQDSLQARRQVRRENFARETNVPEEVEDNGALTDNPDASDNVNKSVENVKPVYLKGLFSVQTTSNKPLLVIRADIIRVLKQLGVAYTEIKGGFSCRHAPSIDLEKARNSPPSPDMASPPLNRQPSKRRISFAGGFRSSVDQRPAPGSLEDEKPLPPRKHTPRQQHLATDNSYAASSGSDSEVAAPAHTRRSMQTAGSRPTPAGETTTHVQSDLGSDMVLVFEIFIVKVPWFRLHGIRFNRVQGGTWQYKDVAGEILGALRL